MRKIFTVEMQIGDNEYSRTYSVLARNMPHAISKGVARAKRDTGNRSARWRCTHANENKVQVI